MESDSDTEEYSAKEELNEDFDEEEHETITTEEKRDFKRFGDIKFSKFFSNISRMTEGLRHAIFDSSLKGSI